MKVRIEKLEEAVAEIPILRRQIADLTATVMSICKQMRNTQSELQIFLASTIPNTKTQTPTLSSSSINTQPNIIPINQTTLPTHTENTIAHPNIISIQTTLPIHTQNKSFPSAVIISQPNIISINTIPPNLQTQQTHHSFKTISPSKCPNTNKESCTQKKGEENGFKPRQRITSLEESKNDTCMVFFAKKPYKNRLVLAHPVRPPDMPDFVGILKKPMAAKPYEEDGNNLFLSRETNKVIVKAAVDVEFDLIASMAKKGEKDEGLVGEGVQADELQGLRVTSMGNCLSKRQDKMEKFIWICKEVRQKETQEFMEDIIMWSGEHLLLNNLHFLIDPDVENCFANQWVLASSGSKEEIEVNMGFISSNVRSKEKFGVIYEIACLSCVVVIWCAGVSIRNGQIDAGIKIQDECNIGGESHEHQVVRIGDEMRLGCAFIRMFSWQNGAKVVSQPVKFSLEEWIKYDEKVQAMVFIAVFGGIGEVGTLQSLLGAIGDPHTSPGVRASKMHMDKVSANLANRQFADFARDGCSTGEAHLWSMKDLVVCIKALEEGFLRILFSILSQAYELLIQWKNLPSFEATWEPKELIKEVFPDFILEDKDVVEDGGIDSHANADGQGMDQRPHIRFRYFRKKKRIGFPGAGLPSDVGWASAD